MAHICPTCGGDAARQQLRACGDRLDQIADTLTNFGAPMHDAQGPILLSERLRRALQARVREGEGEEHAYLVGYADAGLLRSRVPQVEARAAYAAYLQRGGVHMPPVQPTRRAPDKPDGATS